VLIHFSPQMQDDIDDFGFIEIVKCWVEMHGVAVKQMKHNEFVIEGTLIDCFQRAKNQLWRRLDFNLNVAPEIVHSTLQQLKVCVTIEKR
jgi:hypothetical protein